MTKITSWGMYPTIDAQELLPETISSLATSLKGISTVIPRGNGRSYGDSSLAETVIGSKYLDHLIKIDEANHRARVQSGVRLETLLEILIPRGYFLPVVPGTKYITIGGAIASDIHGKNHHIEGTFSDQVQEITVIGSDGEQLTCSRSENTDLFSATCGGMGLTGFVDEVEFALKPISSHRISQTSFKAKNIDELIDLFEVHKRYTYSVAWIDCISSGDNLGRGILMVGEHAKSTGELHYQNKQIPVPMPMMPTWFLNEYSIRAFNFLFYHKQFQKISEGQVSLDSFFFPLDKLKEWNKMYGKNGLTQYQCVIPLHNGREGIKKILAMISQSRGASFLAVLKLLGKANDNFLSFPIEGYTLSLDFKITPDLFPFLEKLNEVVIEYGGRIYLTKDVCLSSEHFRKMYGEKIDKFQNVREKYNAKKFQSMQSRRLEL